MNILILNWRDIKHPLAGGAEISTHEHAKGWVRNGHRVTIFSSYFPNAQFREELDGVSVIRRGSHYTVHLYALLYYLVNARHTVDLVVDEFHFIPFFTPLFVRGKKLAFIHETAQHLWFHNIFFPINYVGFLLEPLFYRFYSRVPFMTVSQSTKKDLIKFGIAAEHIHVIHNGTADVSVRTKKEAEPTIIYLGRLAPDKGIEDALSAFQKVHIRFPRSMLWIVGKEEKTEYTVKLKETLTRYGLIPYVNFFGRVFEKKKHRLLRKSWILIHPSMKEGWGLSVIEAARQGTPTVGYRVSGLTDSVVHGRTGLLSDRGDSNALAENIILLCRDREMYNRLSLNAKRWSKQFTWDNAVSQSTYLIEHLL